MSDKDKRGIGVFDGDAERAAAGAHYRASTQSDGTPKRPASDEDSLPVIVDEHQRPIAAHVQVETSDGHRRSRKTVQAFAEETKLDVRELRQEVGRLTNLIREDAVKTAERIGEALNKSALAQSRADGLTDIEASINVLKAIQADIASLRATVIGEDGNNGKVGNLRAEMGRIQAEIDATIEDRLAEFHKMIWGDEKPAHGDPPVIVEARRGKWILRTLAGIAIGAVTTAGYMIKDSSRNEGETSAKIESNTAAIKVLESQFTIVFTKLLTGASSK